MEGRGWFLPNKKKIIFFSALKKKILFLIPFLTYEYFDLTWNFFAFFWGRGTPFLTFFRKRRQIKWFYIIFTNATSRLFPHFPASIKPVILLLFRIIFFFLFKFYLGGFPICHVMMLFLVFRGVLMEQANEFFFDPLLS